MNTIAERYLRFARHEAAQRSPLYESLARHVAVSPDALAFLDRLPRAWQQPNLLFAAVRHVAGTPATIADFDAALLNNAHAIAEIMLRCTAT
ncbi:DUF2332 family protein [Ensifer aridi]|uniref:DUF2332 family protein n=1 Tax=Ensifer aridi TaxID=1708715 RepID=UPI001FCD4395|nr:DUF2332 family protein [Ensifer aridi]